MPRLPRVYIEESSYYITCKGLPGQKVFNDNRDFEMYFSLLKKYKEELGVKVYSYCLLPDHLHMLVEVDKDTPISAFMHKLTSAYTKYYNSRYERKGHLFRERFQTAFVEKNPQLLLNLTAYIHLNPKRLQLVLQADSYPQSSYGLYINYDQHDDHGLAIKEEVTSLLRGLVGGDYTHFMEQMEKSDEYRSLHKELHRKRMMGSDEFINRVKQEIDLQREAGDSEEEQSLPKALAKPLVSPAGLILMIALTATGAYLYLSARQVQPLAPKTETAAAVVETLKDLDRTEWQILLKGSGDVARADIISFQNNKFSSGNLQPLAYPQTNYSLVREGNKLVWETMQTSAHGTASWRGEVENNVMHGILSLQETGKDPQDFSFTSLTFGRK